VSDTNVLASQITNVKSVSEYAGMAVWDVSSALGTTVSGGKSYLEFMSTIA
jgi:hypothetical protein